MDKVTRLSGEASRGLSAWTRLWNTNNAHTGQSCSTEGKIEPSSGGSGGVKGSHLGSSNDYTRGQD